MADIIYPIANKNDLELKVDKITVVTTLGADDTTIPTSKAVNDELDEIKRVVGMGFEIKSWEAVQQIVRAGQADKYFKVGDQFLTKYDGISYALDVIGINQDTPTDTNFTNSLTVQFHDSLFNGQFSAPQALYLVKDTELVAGDYYFEYLSINYQFTLSQNVPVGGQLTFPKEDNILTTKIYSWATRISTPAIESVSISVGSTGTKLISINDINRCRYGSNNYINSAIRQYLNSNDSVFVWSPKTDYDRPSSYPTAGFLKLLDPELLAVLGKVDKQVARNTVTDGGGQDIFSDKVFLLSQKEVYAVGEGVVTGEFPYEYYSAMATSPTTGEASWRVKYLSASPRAWWLRSPHVGYSYNPRYVYTLGNVYSGSAYTSIGVSPACVII